MRPQPGARTNEVPQNGTRRILSMDAVLLARIQFAITIGFHFIFPPLTIGLAWIIVWMKAVQLRTGSQRYRVMARFFTKLFAISFAVGVASGIVMAFQFGTNWAEYSRFAGDIFGGPLAAEGIFAFFLEATFLGILVFGDKRFSPRLTFFAALMVALGATLSAFWIIVTNSWMQTPAGYEIVAGKAVLTDFWAAVFNPSTIQRYTHTINACLMTGAFFVLAVSAWYLLKGRHAEIARTSLRIALVVGLVSSVLQFGLGHAHAVQVGETQPAKMAAFEGLFETSSRAGLSVFGIPDAEAGKTHLDVRIPGLLSVFLKGSVDAEVKGLEEFPRDEWPPVLITFTTYHIMLGAGAVMLAVAGIGVILWLTGRLETSRWWLWLAVPTALLPQIANQTGWMAAEIGRQPWIVYGLMRTEDGISAAVPAGAILSSIVMFSVIYLMLGSLWVFLMLKKIGVGPEAVSAMADHDDRAATKPKIAEASA